MIRFAVKDDIPKIMQFIGTYWRKGHILSVNEEFFKYEHLFGERVSYVISVDDAEEINAILGYIPYGKSCRDLMTVMWKANHTASPSLGIELFNFLWKNGDARLLASPGSNKKLKGLYEYLGYKFGKMTQWYRLNSHISRFKIAGIVDSFVASGKRSETIEYFEYENWAQFVERFDFDQYKPDEYKPYKEKWYIKKRYFCHPVYQYILIGVKQGGAKDRLLLVFRLISVSGSNVIRLVDCIGDVGLLQFTSYILDELLSLYNAEYVDCYEVGVPDYILQEGGWRKNDGTGNVIPNYFEPFEKANIDIYYFSTDMDVVLFKGDGDQDRPN